MLPRDEDLIIAQCTPQGAGALALIRITGTGVRNLVATCAFLASGKQITEVPSHTIHFGRITDEDGSLLDQVMLMVMDGPRTFTGQDTIEITCHNNRFLIESLIEQMVKKGARIAQEGEFSRRAFLNKKIDLVQAEAIHELISAQTQMALKQSLAQLEGSFSHWIGILEKELLRSIAWCEVSFEFLDEETEFGKPIEVSLKKILTRITELKHTFNAQQQIKSGIRIALIGSVNAGKSSLFNALLKQKRAIVTPIAGTTRDVIEAGMHHKGNYWTLIDTAGLRSTKDTIEQEGIKKSHEEAHKADIILLIQDSSRTLNASEETVYQELLSKYQNKIVHIYSKTDLPQQQRFSEDQQHLTVSVADYESIDRLTKVLVEKNNALFATLESPFLLNKRQYTLLLTLEQKITNFMPLFTETIQYEILSYQLHDALTTLTELTGKSVSEAALDLVFKEFCVGK